MRIEAPDINGQKETKNISCVTCHLSCVMCHVSCVMCHMLRVMCRVSHVTCNLSLRLTATTTDHPTANSPIVHSMLFAKDKKKIKLNSKRKKSLKQQKQEIV